MFYSDECDGCFTFQKLICTLFKRRLCWYVSVTDQSCRFWTHLGVVHSPRVLIINNRGNFPIPFSPIPFNVTTAVRQTGVSEHDGGPIKGPWNPSNITALWYRGVYVMPRWSYIFWIRPSEIFLCIFVWTLYWFIHNIYNDQSNWNLIRNHDWW